jgi:hypothetical protein
MPIPTAYDCQLAEIEDASAAIMVQLRTMQRAAPADVPGMRARLRAQLQAFADSVMLAAREVGT